ncbi:hypothetical protein JCM10207_003572 [Rhodosporidiobolus poonsookiae]
MASSSRSKYSDGADFRALDREFRSKFYPAFDHYLVSLTHERSLYIKHHDAQDQTMQHVMYSISGLIEALTSEKELAPYGSWIVDWLVDENAPHWTGRGHFHVQAAVAGRVEIPKMHKLPAIPELGGLLSSRSITVAFFPPNDFDKKQMAYAKPHEVIVLNSSTRRKYKNSHAAAYIDHWVNVDQHDGSSFFEMRWGLSSAGQGSSDGDGFTQQAPIATKLFSEAALRVEFSAGAYIPQARGRLPEPSKKPRTKKHRESSLDMRPPEM